MFLSIKYSLPKEWFRTNDSKDPVMIGNSDGSNLDQMIVIKIETKRLIRFGSNKRTKFGLRDIKKILTFC